MEVVNENRRYIIGIGSNIDPAVNVAAGLDQLRACGERLVISRILQTEPINMVSDRPFYNLVAYLETELDADHLKKKFDAIEEGLGRDRTDPDRAVKDRTLDLDILVQIIPNTEWDLIYPEVDEYYRPLLRELVAFLRGEALPAEEGGPASVVSLNGQKVGSAPAKIK